MSGLFILHERTITKILKQTLIGMAAVLQAADIVWPTDEQFEEMKDNFAYFRNWNFGDDLVCIVDDTEIKVFRPVVGKIKR